MTWSPGDYVVINIPDLSKFDWRPFTISSSKEGKNVIGRSPSKSRVVMSYTLADGITNGIVYE